MIDENYKNAFKEVYVILENTDFELVKKIPKKFINFLHDNMNNEYSPNIKTEIEIDNQPLLKETEAILSLIYRSYWATNEEKLKFAQDYKEYFDSVEKEKKAKFKNIDEIFNKEENINKVIINNDLAVIPKDNFIKRIINKIFSIFNRK